MKSSILARLVVVLLLNTSSLANAYDDRGAPADPIRLQTATTINQLSADLLSAKLEGQLSDNAMVSSVSLYYALSILERGAKNQSSSLLKALLLTDGYESMNTEVFHAAPRLAKQLLGASDTLMPSAGRFQLTNAIWATNGKTTGSPFVFSDNFRDDAINYYGATNHDLDFKANGASNTVNAWVSDSTNGLIPKIIDDKTLQRFTWLITNAAYFEGAWSMTVNKIGHNRGYKFTGLDGSENAVESLKATGFKGRVLDREDGSLAFEMAFKGQKYALFALIPPAGETELEKWIIDSGVPEMPAVINQYFEARGSVNRLSIQLPLFAFSDQFEMKQGVKIVEQLSLSPLFSKQADLSLMVNTKKTPLEMQATKVGLIKQNTRIELDENGVKAAAVTLVGGIGITSVQPRFAQREVVVDRPFVFAIIERKTRTILFNGAMIKPGSH